tara:strand:+ start:1842 stop:2030 length:189 start_codon:yes stop_codon:yes gene_type:complete
MKIEIHENANYKIIFEWVREKRVVVTDWLKAEDAEGVIHLCNAANGGGVSYIKIHGIERKAA